jgi:basic membrane protein A
MKKVFLTLTATLILLSSCLTPDSEADRTEAEEAAPELSQTKVAVLLPTLGESYTVADEVMIGINRLAQEFSGSIIGREETITFGKGPVFTILDTEAGNEPEQSALITERISGFGLGRYDLVIGFGFHYIKPFETVCDKYPETRFIGVDFVLDVQRSNLTTLQWDMREVTFMAGALAAERFAGDKIGVLGGIDIGFIREDFMDPFVAGAAYMDGITGEKTEVAYEIAGSFNDPALGYAVAEQLYSRGVRCIYEAAGGTGEGIRAAAADSGKTVIGVDIDWGLSLALEGKPASHILTSTVKRWDEAVYLVCREYFLTATLPVGNQIVGLAEGCAELAVNPYNAPLLGTQLDTIRSLKAAILSGEIDVSRAPVRAEVWQTVETPFTSAVVTVADPVLTSGIPGHYGPLLQEALSTEFITAGGYRVISREQVGRLVSEINFSMGGLTDEAAGLEAGRLVAAEAIVFVKLAEIGDKINLDCKLVMVETGLAAAAVRAIYTGMDALLEDLPSVIRQLGNP